MHPAWADWQKRPVFELSLTPGSTLASPSSYAADELPPYSDGLPTLSAGSSPASMLPKRHRLDKSADLLSVWLDRRQAGFLPLDHSRVRSRAIGEAYSTASSVADMPQVIHLGPSKKYYNASSSESSSSSSSSSDSSFSDYDYKHRHHKKRSSRRHKHKARNGDRVVVTEAIVDKNGKRTELVRDSKGRIETKSKDHVSAKTRLEHPHSIKGLLAASAQTRLFDVLKVAAADYGAYYLEGLVRRKSGNRRFKKPTFDGKELAKDLLAGIGGDLGVRGPGVVRGRKHGRPEHKRHRHRHTHRF